MSSNDTHGLRVIRRPRVEPRFRAGDTIFDNKNRRHTVIQLVKEQAGIKGSAYLLHREGEDEPFTMRQEYVEAWFFKWRGVGPLEGSSR
jgi:hypothetical protein